VNHLNIQNSTGLLHCTLTFAYKLGKQEKTTKVAAGGTLQSFNEKFSSNKTKPGRENFFSSKKKITKHKFGLFYTLSRNKNVHVMNKTFSNKRFPHFFGVFIPADFFYRKRCSLCGKN